MKTLSILALLALSPAVFAQDTVNTHGFHMTPGDGDLNDPLRSWHVESNEQHTFSLDTLGEYAHRPLVRYQQYGNDITRSIEIQDFAALNMGAFYAPHKRLAITATAPVFLAVEGNENVSGAGVGDIRVSAPVAILLMEDSPIGLALVPHLDIPGLYNDQYLRSAGLSGGGVLVATVNDNRWEASANLGAQFAPEVEVENLSGNERLLTALSGSYIVTDELALRGEFTFYPALTKNDVPWTDSPAEATLSVRGHADHRMAWTAGVSSALSKGVGAATFRGFLGLNWSLGAREEEVRTVTVPQPCPKCEVDVAVVPYDEEGNLIIEAPLTVIQESSGEEAWISTGDWITLPGPDRYALLPECPAPELVVIENDKIILLEPIYFDFDKATIRFPESEDVLQDLQLALHEHPEITLIEVAGHTDERGSHEYNDDLSQRRMNAVVRYLVGAGIEESRLRAVGYGEQKPYVKGCNTHEEEVYRERCHQLNRRVEFTILERSDD